MNGNRVCLFTTRRHSDLRTKDKFVESYAYCDNIPATISIFGRTGFHSR